MWRCLENDEDIFLLKESIDSFHDSCVVEISYVSGAYVSEDLSIFPINNVRKMKITVQRQASSMNTIELEFFGVYRFELYPVDESFTCEIQLATLALTDSGIVWYDCEPLGDQELDNYRGIKVYAKSARWRPKTD